MRLFFYAQTRAEEISRKSGARVARRVGKKVIPLLDCTDLCRGIMPQKLCMGRDEINKNTHLQYYRNVVFYS